MIAESFRDNIIPFVFNQYDRTVLKEVQSRGMKAYYVRVKVAPDCLMKSVRVFMIFKSLEADGEIIKTIPDSQDLDEGHFEDEFHIVLVNRLDETTIRERIDAISEVEAGTVRPINIEVSSEPLILLLIKEALKQSRRPLCQVKK